MLIYCRNTGKMIDPDLRFQQPLKDAWLLLVTPTLAMPAMLKPEPTQHLLVVNPIVLI
jgi:hypothetical protein